MQVLQHKSSLYSLNYAFLAVTLMSGA